MKCSSLDFFNKRQWLKQLESECFLQKRTRNIFVWKQSLSGFNMETFPIFKGSNQERLPIAKFLTTWSKSCLECFPLCSKHSSKCLCLPPFDLSTKCLACVYRKSSSNNPSNNSELICKVSDPGLLNHHIYREEPIF